MSRVLSKQQQQIFGLRDLLTVLFKHKIKIIISFVIIMIGTAFFAVRAPSFYVARSVIMIKPGRESMPLGDTGLDMRLPAVSQESLMNTEMQLITSNDLIGNVIKLIGVYELYPDLRQSQATGSRLLDVAIARFRGDLLAKDIKGSNVIEILFRHKNPYMAQKGANIILECLKDKHIEVYGAPKSTFIEDQLKIFKGKVTEAENKLAEYKREKNISSLKDQFWWLVGKKTELESQLRIEESKLRELQEKINFLKNQKRRVVSDLYTSTTRAKLTELQRRETELLATYKENSRPVKNIRKEIQTVQDALSRYEEENKESSEWVTMEAEIGSQQIKIDSMRKQAVELSKELEVLSGADKEYKTMERELEAAQKSYESYLKKHEDLMISEDLDRRKITNLNVIEVAPLPMSPIKANLQKILGIGLFLAITTGIGWAYLAEYLPQCMTTPQFAQRYLRLPLIVVINKKT